VSCLLPKPLTCSTRRRPTCEDCSRQGALPAPRSASSGRSSRQTSRRSSGCGGHEGGPGSSR